MHKECNSDIKFIKDEISEKNKDSFVNCNNEKIILKKISFKYETIPICENIHLETRNGNINTCQKALSNSEFYWDGYSTTMEM